MQICDMYIIPHFLFSIKTGRVLYYNYNYHTTKGLLEVKDEWLDLKVILLFE